MATIRETERDMLPHDNQIERNLAGALLIDPDAVIACQEARLDVADWYTESLSWIYDAARTLTKQHASIDYVTLGHHLDSVANGQGSRLNALGGYAALTELITDTATSVHAGHWASMVHRLAQQRRLISAAGDIAAQAHQYDGPIEGLYDSASRRFFDVVDVSQPKSHLYGTDDVLMAYITNQQAREDRLAANPDAFLVTGLVDLDGMLTEIAPGLLHVVAARPSVGKTIYMEGIAETNAKRGHKVAFYHLELSHQQMLDRRMARHSGVDVGRLKRGYSGGEIVEAFDKIAVWQRNVTMIHCPGWSAERITTDATRLHAKGQADIVIVDYLQKLAMSTTSAWNLSALYGLQAETLKNMAESLGIPVVLGSQVSRAFKGRADERPHMEDIRNSGEIEEKANQIVVLHRPSSEREDGERIEFGQRERLEAWVDKNTEGSVGRVCLQHVAGRYTLESVVRGQWWD